jgi:simple sugar transport system permease protein
MKEVNRGLSAGPPEAARPDTLAEVLRPGLALSARALLIPALSLALLSVLVLFLSRTPGETLFYFFLGPFGSVYQAGNMLAASAPLILGGLGVSIAMKAGSLNLGGEGQIYGGAFAATIAALGMEFLGPIAAAPALLAGALAAGIAAAIPGLCKAKWNTSELITSFLLSNALVLLVNYLVNGPFLDPATNLQSTRLIAPFLRLPPLLPPSRLSASLFCALGAALGAHIFLSRTKTGYEFRMAGANELFARYGGINTKCNTVIAMFISGACYGLAGGLAVFGTYYGTIKEFSSGMGWNGLAAALVARFHPLLVVPASIFFAWISSGARIAMQKTDITFELASIVQAVIFFLATSKKVRAGLIKRRKP